MAELIGVHIADCVNFNGAIYAWRQQMSKIVPIFKFCLSSAKKRELGEQFLAVLMFNYCWLFNCHCCKLDNKIHSVTTDSKCLSEHRLGRRHICLWLLFGIVPWLWRHLQYISAVPMR